MSNLEFTNFITKGIKVEEDGERRIFKGHITAEIVDRQNEIIAVDQVMKAMKNFMAVMPVLTDIHSNRVMGKVISHELSEIEGYPSVLIKAEVFKQEGVTLYDQVWDKIVKKEYEGLSMGGASKSREPIIKDGRLVMKLENLEIYEIAVCPAPANQLAIIKYVNEFAKAANMMEKIKIRDDGIPYLQCNSILCSIEKASLYKCVNCGKEYAEPFQKCGGCGGSMKKSSEGTNSDTDLDIDNKNAGMGEKIEKIIKEEIVKTVKKELIMYNSKPYDESVYRKMKEEETKKVYAEGTTRATQAEMDAKNKEYEEIAEKKKDEFTEQGFPAGRVEAPREPVSQKDVHEKDLVYKCNDKLYKDLQVQILKNAII